MPPPGFTTTPLGQRPSGQPRPPGFTGAPQQPGVGEATGAAVQGTSRGMASSLPILGGWAGGIMTGGNPLGIALGIGAGEAGRRIWEGTTDVPTYEEVDPELRPFHVGGELVGGSIVPGAMPAMTTGKTGVRFIDKILDVVRRRPGVYAASEGLATVGASVGAGVGEAVAPGPGGQIVGGIAGGVVPGAGLYATTRTAEGIFNQLRQRLQTTENRAINEIRNVFQEAGDDPQQVARALRELPSGDTRTAAQAVDSPALQLLEAELSRRSPQFAREANERAAKSLEAMRLTIGRLSSSGDPTAMRQAAQLRDDYFRGLLTERLALAEQQAVQAAQRITGDSPIARAELGRRTHEILSNALTQARAAERAEWAKIPQHAFIGRTAITAEANRITREDLARGEKLPSLVQANIKGRGMNVGEMLRFRSRMLDEARDAAARNESNLARIYGNMAEAALEDLNGTQGVEAARAFSRELNDVFTRSFAGESLRTDARGANRIPPELLLRRAVASTPELTNLRLQQLERAVRLGNPEAADEMLGIQRRLLALAASDLVDPRTELVTPQRLSRFVRANEEVLERFPEVKETLQSVGSANAYLDAIKRGNQRAQRQIQREAAFSRVAGMENPVRAVDQIIRGNSPQQQFRQLAILARRDSDAAVEGLRSSVLENAYERAGGNSGDFSFSTYRNELFEAPRPGGVSPMDLMRRYGVIDREYAGNLGRLLDRAARIEEVQRTKPQLESLLANEDALTDLVLRVVGSTSAAGAAGAAGSRNTLIAQSAGSRFARHIFNKLPAGKTQELLEEVAAEPQLMASFLERSPSETEKIAIARKIHAWMAGLGLLQLDQGEEQ